VIRTSSSVVSVCFVSKGAHQETGSALNYCQLPVTFSTSNTMQSQHLFFLRLISSAKIDISYTSALPVGSTIRYSLFLPKDA